MWYTKDYPHFANEPMSHTKMQQRLERAAKDGDFDELQLLIGLTDPKRDDSAALCYAARNGHTDCVELLIPVSDPKANGSWALQEAAARGKTQCVELLIPVSDVEADDHLALLSAATYGHTDCLMLLLDATVRLDKHFNFERVLSKACVEGHLECVKYLIPVCSQENANNVFVDTVNRHRLECAQELAALGVSKDNCTRALEAACRNEDLPMVKWLFPLAETSEILQYAHNYFSFMEHAPPLMDYLEEKIAEQQKQRLLDQVTPISDSGVKKRKM